MISSHSEPPRHTNLSSFDTSTLQLKTDAIDSTKSIEKRDLFYKHTIIITKTSQDLLRTVVDYFPATRKQLYQPPVPNRTNDTLSSSSKREIPVSNRLKLAPSTDMDTTRASLVVTSALRCSR